MSDAHHPPFPLLSASDPSSFDRARDALADADTVDGFGVDVAATLAWSVRTGSRRPRTLAATWDLLAATAARDVAAARIVEPHLDALGILDEADADGLDRSGSWGVFAAEAPGMRLRAIRDGRGWRLSGTKPWCSLAAHLDHALVTAWVDDERRGLFALDLRDPAVVARPGPWHARGLQAVVSAPIDVDAAVARPVGEPGWYLRRPGFAHGGVGVAACWWGAALPVRGALREAARREGADQLSRTHLGRADAALWAARAALAETAAVFDGGESSSPGLRAARVRTIVADAVETTLAEAARALGPLPLVADEGHARRVADLQVYVRQHHGDRDLARLGAAVSEGDGAW